MSGIRAIVCVAVLAGSSGIAAAQAEQGADKGVFGIGIIVGEPTGVSAKLYLGGDSNMAVDAAAGSAVVGGGLQAHADVLWHPFILTDEDSFVLPAYGGVGLRLLDAGGRTVSDFHVGIRGVVGILFDFKTVPLDAFVEVAGVLDWVFSD
ncbi:MAG TPA: hypothetical protein VML75_21825, partial [Kofleriaceae bacterium]|nr:hypothetical protein [Kofleriaceae bacterium]